MPLSFESILVELLDNANIELFFILSNAYICTQSLKFIMRIRAEFVLSNAHTCRVHILNNTHVYAYI